MKKIILILTIIAFANFAQATNYAVTVKRTVEKDEILTLDNLVEVDYKKENMPIELFTKKEDLLVLQTLITLRPGIFIRDSFVRVKPAVAKGEDIKVGYNVPGINVESIGIAMQDGNLDEIVEVMNKNSKKIIKGKVVADGYVSVSQF